MPFQCLGRVKSDSSMIDTKHVTPWCGISTSRVYSKAEMLKLWPPSVTVRVGSSWRRSHGIFVEPQRVRSGADGCGNVAGQGGGKHNVGDARVYDCVTGARAPVGGSTGCLKGGLRIESYGFHRESPGGGEEVIRMVG